MFRVRNRVRIRVRVRVRVRDRVTVRVRLFLPIGQMEQGVVRYVKMCAGRLSSGLAYQIR